MGARTSTERSAEHELLLTRVFDAPPQLVSGVDRAGPPRPVVLSAWLHAHPLRRRPTSRGDLAVVHALA